LAFEIAEIVVAQISNKFHYAGFCRWGSADHFLGLFYRLDM